MKYWVFNDARILGPYSREELAGLEAVHSGTLVCQEGTSGVADGDWRALEAVPELAGLAFAGAPVGGYAASPFSETMDPSDAAAAAWPPPYADDPRFGFWMREEADEGRSVEFARTLAEMREQMARNERRQDEILDRLNAKDAQLQQRDKEIADLRARLTLFETGAMRPAALPVAKAPAPAAAPAPSQAAKAPPPTAPPAPVAKAPEQPAIPPLAAKAPPPSVPEAAAPPSLQMESALEASAPSLEVPPPAGEDESPARKALRAARAAKTGTGLPASTGPMEFALPSAAPEMPSFDPPAAEPFPPLEAPLAPAFDGIPESEGLSPVAEMPPPLDFAPPFPEAAFASSEPPPLDAPPPFSEPPLADPSAPPPMSPFGDPAFQVQAQPQQPGQLAHPQTVIFGGGGGGINLTPSPSPLGPSPFGSTPEPIPLGDPGSMATPMPMMGQPDLPQTVMQGLGVGGQATPFPFGQQTPLPRLPGQQTSAFDQPITASPRPLETSPGAPPQVPPTGATKPSAVAKVKDLLRSKKFVIILAVSVLALAGILAMFLRNPKQLAKTVDMAPDQKASGSFEENGPAPRTSAPSPFQKAPSGDAPPAGDDGPAPAPAPKPAAPPAKGKDYVSDGSVRAIEFVKNYKLDEARGTVGAYLQYAFLGPDTTPGWQAGAIEKDVWFVQYNVFKGTPGGRGAKPTYSFRFEVDLAKRTLKGVNPSAQDMLNPGGQNEKPKRRQRRRASGGDGQEPLPGDDDLQGASGGSTGFNNPGG